MKVLESLNRATEFLEQQGVECSRRNSELLLCHILQCRPAELYLNTPSLNSAQVNELAGFLDRRSKGLPVQYIMGTTEFMGLEFMVDSSVLIPRPETELLVETVVKKSTVHPLAPRLRRAGGSRFTDKSNHSFPTILDIGTGCGNIAISLTKYLNRCKMVATDVSEEALEVARRNARFHKLQDRVTFLKGDLFEVFGSEEKKTGFEIIVSNPPYIPSSQLKNLSLEVKHEPKIALDGGETGLYYYRRIISETPEYLVKDGYLIMEIGFGQLKGVKEIIESSGWFGLVEVVKDYSGIERVVVVQKTEI